MVGIVALWLPILVSAVFVFLASSVIHMLIPWHKSDYPMLPDEAKFLDALRALNIPAGDYMAPRPKDRQDMRSAEFDEKVKRGPCVVITLWPGGPMSMGKNLIQWFLFSIVISIFAAYVTSHAFLSFADVVYFPRVFRLAAVTAFLGYAVGLWQMSIWYHRSWLTTFKLSVDGLVYALITAGVFCWLWPM